MDGGTSFLSDDRDVVGPAELVDESSADRHQRRPTAQGRSEPGEHPCRAVNDHNATNVPAPVRIGFPQEPQGSSRALTVRSGLGSLLAHSER